MNTGGSSNSLLHTVPLATLFQSVALWKCPLPARLPTADATWLAMSTQATEPDGTETSCHPDASTPPPPLVSPPLTPTKTAPSPSQLLMDLLSVQGLVVAAPGLS